MWCISVFIELKYFILIVTLTEPPAQRRVLYAVVIFMCLSVCLKCGSRVSQMWPRLHTDLGTYLPRLI